MIVTIPERIEQLKKDLVLHQQTFEAAKANLIACQARLDELVRILPQLAPPETVAEPEPETPEGETPVN